MLRLAEADFDPAPVKEILAKFPPEIVPSSMPAKVTVLVVPGTKVPLFCQSPPTVSVNAPLIVKVAPDSMVKFCVFAPFAPIVG